MALAVGVDIGGTNIKIGLVDENGKIVARQKLKTNPQSPPAETLERLSRMILRLTKGKQVDALGIGVAGLIDHKTGFVWTSPNLPTWNKTPVKDIMSRLTGMEVFCGNDANAVALGEWLFGAAKNCKNVLCITLGTGIGSGIIAENRLLLGANSYAGELGHTSISLRGPACPCGSSGCLERFVSAQAIVERCKRLLRKEERLITTTKNQLSLFGGTGEHPSLIFDLIGYDYKRLSTREIGIAARKKDKLALEVIKETGNLLGQGIYNALMILDPEIVILGGGVSRLGKPLLYAVEQTVFNRLYGSNRQLRIVLSKLGDDAGILGASQFKLVFR
ncbi:MAG: ROK family protein [candidate division WOR-3 bacterium]